jgi:hypothetical protein
MPCQAEMEAYAGLGLGLVHSLPSRHARHTSRRVNRAAVSGDVSMARSGRDIAETTSHHSPDLVDSAKHSTAPVCSAAQSSRVRDSPPRAPAVHRPSTTLTLILISCACACHRVVHASIRPRPRRRPRATSHIISPDIDGLRTALHT